QGATDPFPADVPKPAQPTQPEVLPGPAIPGPCPTPATASAPGGGLPNTSAGLGAELAGAAAVIAVGAALVIAVRERLAARAGIPDGADRNHE
ncbi:MAG: hypothetical protein M3O87_00265, partial [Candidatus Dormibacteraeota bacterium]|nr:hypothetical protein [Candidatus Dormibacteraeota bacterium]